MIQRIGLVLLVAAALAVGARTMPAAQSGPFKAGDVLPAWTSGTVELHQVVTARGSANCMMFPDGTTLLLDAGDQGEVDFASQRPDATRSPAQWIARYITHMERQVDPAAEPRLDYMVLTHFHAD